jgi:hypothetical protein
VIDLLMMALLQAVAGEPAAAPSPDETIAAQPAPTPAQPETRRRRVCEETEVTGARIAQRRCRTVVELVEPTETPEATDASPGATPQPAPSAAD